MRASLWQFFPDSYSFLRQWELGRFFVPQGPLDPRDLDEDLLQEWSRLPLDRLYDALKRLSATKDKYSKIPASLPPSFWRALQGGGGEIACERAGTLVYRAAIKSDAYKPRFELAPPIVGASRRLWRHFPTRRLLRVSLDERTEWLLCSKKSKDREVKAMFLSWLRVPILHLGELLLFVWATCRLTSLYRPILQMLLPQKTRYFVLLFCVFLSGSVRDPFFDILLGDTDPSRAR